MDSKNINIKQEQADDSNGVKRKSSLAMNLRNLPFKSYKFLDGNNNTIKKEKREKVALKFSGLKLSSPKIAEIDPRNFKIVYMGASSLAVMIIEEKVFVKCVNGCVFKKKFPTDAMSQLKITMKDHFDLKHTADQRWNGFCSSCGRYIFNDVNKLTLMDELEHLIGRHIISAAVIPKTKSQ